MFGEVVLVILIICLFAGAGAIYYMNRRKPVSGYIGGQIRYKAPPPPKAGEHAHAAGTFKAGIGAICDVRIGEKEDDICGLHKHIFSPSGNCTCGAKGEPGLKIWAAE